MNAMSREKFLELVSRNEGDLWWPGKALAEELRLHLREEEEIFGWLHLREGCGSYHEHKHYPSSRNRQTGLVTRQRFFLAYRDLREQEVSIAINSTPLGRLRNVETWTRRGDKGHIWGRLSLDFAGGVLGADSSGSHYQFEHSEEVADWPTPEVTAFLDAVYAVWR